jgi:molybdopterin/thiamine biosynthesis adenylyltransferase
MSRLPRWWQTGECSVEKEQERFAQAGLDFRLDQQLFERAEVVVFHGQLRFGDRRWHARVIYPPGYASDYQPNVYAPGLKLPRHARSDGLLCLDHPTLGERSPMNGAEAIQRAELLWRLSVEDPETLRGLEADAPEPAIDTYHFEPFSAVYLFGIEATGHKEGWMRIAAGTRHPFRGALDGLGAEKPAEVTRVADAANRPFHGATPVCGFWRRIDAPPPGPTTSEIHVWLQGHHAELVERALNFATAHSQVIRTSVPALVAFVFPDEGPQRDEYHDEWLVILVDSDDGKLSLPRPIVVHCGDQFTRQPQLSDLAHKRVAIIGTGALGSQIAALLARAGTGYFYLVDPDAVTPGILVRHQLDYDAVGIAKVAALHNELLKINPYISVETSVHRYGDPGSDAVTAQREDDAVTDRLATCDLIVNATAHTATGFHISRAADTLQRPVLHVAVSSGAWGGRVLVQRHGHSGCLECLAHHQNEPVDGAVTVPCWPEDPELPEVMDRGCAQSTFTGPGFEITTTAAAAVRVAVAELLVGDGYPARDFDLATLSLRDGDTAQPNATYIGMDRHPACTSCSV